MDSGYKGFPERARPYIDYNAIGVEYHAEHGGAFTVGGYTIRRSSAKPLIVEREQDAALRGHLKRGARCFCVSRGPAPRFDKFC